jgi:DNA-binding SARP family transcriptional activator
MAERVGIHLLGAPFVTLGDVPGPGPRGHKAWGLLAYLLATESAPSRLWLAELLFSEAEDPLNALSWSLSQLRRLLGPGAAISGDPVELKLSAGTFVDVRALTLGTWVQALGIPGLGHELLERLAFPSSPAFEVWLLTERRRLAGATEDVLREGARARLAAGDAARATALAGRLVAINPLDEDAQELLIRAYSAAGERSAAERQREACVALFRRELGIDPGAAVLRAADVEVTSGPTPVIATRIGVETRLEAGLAAMDAGALDAGISALRLAVAEADVAAEPDLRRHTLVALGSALVHGVRGRDGEGADVLHQAIEIEKSGKADVDSARAHRELGYVEMLRGRYDRARRWLGQAASLAGDNHTEAAWARAVEGVALTDVGRHAVALRALDQGLRLAREGGERSIEAWALTFIGRIHLLRGELAEARGTLEPALEIVRQLRWTAFLPLPETFLADVDLAEGRTDAAATAYEHAYALSLQLGDPCWEGVAARGIGLVANRRGDPAEALRWVAEARIRCVRLPDAWLWVEGYCLDALCTLAIEQHRPEAKRWISDMEALATRTGMRELVARAYAHRARLGDAAAAGAVRVLAAEVDNPALQSDSGPASTSTGRRAAWANSIEEEEAAVLKRHASRSRSSSRTR